MSDPFEAIAETARRMKLDKVREFGNDPDDTAADLIPFVVCVRRGHQVAEIMAKPGPDGAREAVYMAALMMRSDELYVVADSRMKMADPDSGEGIDHIGQGDLERDRVAGKRDRIKEVMLIWRMPLIGASTCVIYPYERKGNE